ncbi:LPD7 domain-containing protein [Burkholderia cenocepacia]|uniref:LPD7 domain-containing protein n=1 Tax=Burkholderia cenocepacia TaxID=95486 RepID=UPI002AB61527|nr:LPD7 domain-containing protein [Burkholderia cenocepacia]
MTAWRAMPDDRHELAADDIFHNISANVSYAEILQTIDTEMVGRVKTLVAENERKSAEKEARKARELEDHRAALLTEQQAALRIAESFKDAGRVPDEEWGQLGRTVDRVYLGGDRADLGAALELATAMARVDASRPCPFPESPVQRAFESERTYQASRASVNHEQVIDDLALRAGNEGDPAPRYVLERRQAVEHYAFGLELRLEALRAANADVLALRDTQDLLAIAHARAKLLTIDNSETAQAEKTEELRDEAPAQAEIRDDAAQVAPTPAPAVASAAASQSPAVEEADGFAGGAKDGDADDKPFDPELVISKLLENVTYKAQKDGSVLYMVSERPAFVDHGQQIVMADKANEDEEAILAAVLLAKEKYGGAFELTGSEAFQRRAIEIMLKHKVDVTLKNPQQDALRRELTKAAGDASKSPEAQQGTEPKPHIGKPANDDHRTDNASATSSSDVPAEAPASQLAADMIPVRALDWWAVQREAIQVWAKSDDELRADLEELGPQPSSDLFYWFDRAGKPCDPPADADGYLATLKSEPAGFVSGSESELCVRDAMSDGEVSAKWSNSEVIAMSDNQASKENEPKLILRGVRKLDNGEFDTTALLFKGNGDYLQGFIKVGNEKHQVIAHMNERKNPDPETGEIKPNFLKLVEPHGNGDDTNWKELGFGNAVNRRSDGKPVYFDEVLFSVGNEVIKARITKNVDDELHRKLGFQEARQARPKDDNKSGAAPGEASPKPTAPAAKAQEDAAGAPKTRRSSRAKAA